MGVQGCETKVPGPEMDVQECEIGVQEYEIWECRDMRLRFRCVRWE